MFFKLSLSLLLVAAFAAPALSKDYFPYKFGTCIMPKLGKVMDAERFFNGHWYAVKSVGNYLFQLHGTCLSTELQLKNGKINLLHYQYEPLFDKYANVRGTAQAKYAKFMGAFFPATYDALGGVYQIEVPFSVVDTDYDNWAVVYFCKQHLTFKAEMAWMMQRNRKISNLNQMESVVKKIGMDETQFTLQDNSNCPSLGEPHL